MHQQRVQNPKLKPLIGFLVIVGIVAAVLLDSFLAQLLTALVSEKVAAIVFWVLGLCIAMFVLRRFVLSYSYLLSGSVLRVCHAYGRYERLIDDVYLNTLAAFGTPDELKRRYPDARVQRAVLKRCPLETRAVVYRNDQKLSMILFQPDETICKTLEEKLAR